MHTCLSSNLIHLVIITNLSPEHVLYLHTMASQKDVQDLLRLLTTGRNKLPMLAAMGRVKALQTAGLRRYYTLASSLICYSLLISDSISNIAASDLPALTEAISDEKAAKSLLAACKAHLKSASSTSSKRPATETLSSSAKKHKSAYELSNEPQTPAELEASLELPQPSVDEEAISKCTVYTNRAPLVLAFAVQLLKYTMPEQPLSGRLSLAQAVVSVNSRSKAQSLGIEKGRGAEEEGWGQGQPKVRVMGREISVLKRGGYEWRESEDVVKTEAGAGTASGEIKKEEATSTAPDVSATKGWTVSAPVTSKQSRFIARSIEIHSRSSATPERELLLSNNPELRDASHNITAWRVQGTHGIIEGSDDDGETGGGRHLLGLLQADHVFDVLLVVTRWYGGVFLGPDRWRIMSQVSRDALSQRLRVAGTVGQEALWGLDLEAMRSSDAPVTGGTGMPIYRPEGVRAYILKAFASPPATGEGGDAAKKKKKTGAVLEREKEENLGMLLGALDLLFKSWVEHLSRDELDRRAWGWYVSVRPEVESGVAGWGGKGEVKLVDILNLRRKPS